MDGMRHHAIVVTSLWPDVVAIRDSVAAIAPGLTSGVTKSLLNGYGSFFVAPDGSKESRPESDDGDSVRNAVIIHLETYRYEDGSTSVDWAEVQYGDDSHETYCPRDSDSLHPRARG